MQFELSEEHRMLKDLVARFVRDELMPLEAAVMQREPRAAAWASAPRNTPPGRPAKELGLFGLDAPEDVGGSDLRCWPWSASRRRSAGPSPLHPAAGRRTCGC